MGGFLLADFLTVVKSAGRFTDCCQICWQIWGVFLLEDFLNITKSASRNGRFLLVDFLTVSKSASRIGGISDGQIYWLLQKLPADIGGISASRFHDCQQICCHILTVSKSTSRNTPHFCWHIWWVRQSASWNPSPIIAGIFDDSLSICQFWANFSHKAGRLMNTDVFHERPIISNIKMQMIWHTCILWKMVFSFQFHIPFTCDNK